MKLLILDRDGTINKDSDDYIKRPEEWIPLPGALEAIAKASRAGWRIVIATNQSGIARGMFDIAALHAMQRKLEQLLAPLGGRIDSVFFCPHAPDAGCDCRKPRTGLLQQIAARYQVSLASVPFIGDSDKDLAAARAVGARPILVRTGKGEATFRALPDSDRVEVYPDLAAAIDTLLSEPG